MSCIGYGSELRNAAGKEWRIRYPETQRPTGTVTWVSSMPSLAVLSLAFDQMFNQSMPSSMIVVRARLC